MISNKAELATQRMLTRAFIDADPTTIVLVPRIKTKSSTGGFLFVKQTPREPQKFKIVERVSDARTDTRVQGGTQEEAEFTLVGAHDAVVSRDDVFEYGGQEWQVLVVSWFNGYEQRAQVRRYGA